MGYPGELLVSVRRLPFPPIALNQSLTGAGVHTLPPVCLLTGAAVKCDLHSPQTSSVDRDEDILWGLFSVQPLSLGPSI